MGVGPREMGYLFGQYRRLTGHFQGSFTGPKIFWSGSSLRTEATVYGLNEIDHSDALALVNSGCRIIMEDMGGTGEIY
ncbi:uncharacterized protein A4U43_C06F12740 [Asparagus officinalis]|uniref:Uncharacterized protein n=1 Tax=Asparagus officinalis TaxID=4686 RepID=A0A5P1ELR1_ASPOF|nr:uncharacterized protein A4U43_C06F12740 [Asparagus officinalis]